MRAAILIAVALLPLGARGAVNTPGAMAVLVSETNLATIEPAVLEGLKSPDRVTRATAARVASVRRLVTVLPALRDALAAEKDVDVAAEMAAAAVMLGENDLAAMLVISDRFQARLERTITGAVARSRPARAVEDYIRSFRSRRVSPDYFLIATWGHPERLVVTSARLLGLGDERGWSMVLDAAKQSAVAAPATVLEASLTSKSPAIRSDTIWYLVHGYHPDPSKLPQSLRAAVAATDTRGDMTVEEEFGRELVRRMFGSRPREEGRWLEWLRGAETQPMNRVDTSLDTLLTDRERKARWEKPATRVIKGSIQSREVARPAYILPSPLPAGLAADILRETKCQGGWLGLARTTVDLSGRVQSVDLGGVSSDEPCLAALRTLVQLSLATNTSLLSPLTIDHLVVKGRGTPPCLDATSALDDKEGPIRVAASVKGPVVIRRVEPVFPADAKQAMPQGSNVIVIAECEVSRTGCVRRIRLLQQSPFGSLNAATVLALSQWKFKPGTVDGEPVDVVFNLTINFKVP
jgi:TonB family protein